MRFKYIIAYYKKLTKKCREFPPFSLAWHSLPQPNRSSRSPNLSSRLRLSETIPSPSAKEQPRQHGRAPWQSASALQMQAIGISALPTLKLNSTSISTTATTWSLPAVMLSTRNTSQTSRPACQVPTQTNAFSKSRSSTSGTVTSGSSSAQPRGKQKTRKPLRLSTARLWETSHLSSSVRQRLAFRTGLRSGRLWGHASVQPKPGTKELLSTPVTEPASKRQTSSA